MPLSDLLGKKTRTVSGVDVGAPTVRQFFRALEVFGTEIGIIREAARQIPGGLLLEVAVAPFLVSPDDGRLKYVLDRPGWENADAVHAVALFVAPLAARIDGLLGVPGEGGEDTEDIESGVLLVLGCAERFHIDPMVVMDWPLGLFLDVVNAFSRPPSRRSSGIDLVGSIPPTHIPGLPFGGTNG